MPPRIPPHFPCKWMATTEGLVHSIWAAQNHMPQRATLSWKRAPGFTGTQWGSSYFRMRGKFTQTHFNISRGLSGEWQGEEGWREKRSHPGFGSCLGPPVTSRRHQGERKCPDKWLAGCHHYPFFFFFKFILYLGYIYRVSKCAGHQPCWVPGLTGEQEQGPHSAGAEKRSTDQIHTGHHVGVSVVPTEEGRNTVPRKHVAGWPNLDWRIGEASPRRD